MLFLDFFYTLRGYGVPVTVENILEFEKAIEKGLISDIDELYTVSRLICVKKIEDIDNFDRAFSSYFLGLDLPKIEDISDLYRLLENKPFKEWLDEQIKEGNLRLEDVRWNIPPEELFKRFIETVMRQTEAHHGGNKWVGTEGTSPFGHSGKSYRGIRVYGESGQMSAIKTIGERRYIDYSIDAGLKSENIRQALGFLKNMVPKGPMDEIDLDETIYQMAKNGGEIEFIFKSELRDDINVVLLIDNGGYSMTPYARLVSLVFSKMKDRFRNLSTYYFRNCVYGNLFLNPQRTKIYSTEKFLSKRPDTRVIIIGDAAMAPEELFSPQGSIEYGVDDSKPGYYWLERINKRFRYCVWLNPIRKGRWDRYGSQTFQEIRKIFHMEDLTLGGIKSMVEYLKGE